MNLEFGNFNPLIFYSTETLKISKTAIRRPNTSILVIEVPLQCLLRETGYRPLNPLLLDSQNLARILHEEADNPVIRTDGTGLQGKSQQWTGSSVERLSFGSVSFCRFLCRVASALVCPCDLGECSLVCWLFFQNLPGIGGYGLQCLGLEEFLATFLFQKLVISSTQSVLPIFKL